MAFLIQYLRYFAIEEIVSAFPLWFVTVNFSVQCVLNSIAFFSCSQEGWSQRNLLNLNILRKLNFADQVIKILTPQGKLTLLVFIILYIFPKTKTTNTHTTFLQSCTHTMGGSQNGTPNGWFCVQTYHGRPDTLAPFIDNYKLTLYMVPSLEIAYQPSAHAGSPAYM